MPAFDDPDIASILGAARQAYVAVDSKGGPHVTPQLYGLADGNLWFFAAATTLKAKVLRREPRVGVMVRQHDRAVVVGGTVDVLDPADVGSILEQFPHWRRTAGGVASFTLRNAADLAGFVTDTVRRRAGRIPPPRRVLFSVRPERMALIEGGAVTRVSGDWPGRGIAAAADGGPGPEANVAIAYSSPLGPLALPAAWDDGAHTATLPSRLAEVASLPDASGMSVVFDEYGRPGPGGKRGLLLRGDGRLDGKAGRVSFTPDHGVRWDGVHTERVATGDR